ncbi:glutamine synthetase III family protein [Rhodoflexus caldus]|uniref:glutamine synthetase III family protein n=1 Tax=Rhodoflexus caldus TaxID=2891236 RepID=UPI00202AB0F7|nr:glutamine synthetase III [Rhodoflexus caldus]
MSRLRFIALEQAASRGIVDVAAPSKKVSDYYGMNVFGDEAMKSYLSSDMYKKLKAHVQKGETLDEALADAVAAAMKTWALERGVTHYTHWFQPLTGSTAEKHDAFFEPSDNGKVLEKFKGSALVRQEPDASSFPSGGIRNTFEARGYTAWDPTSPAFIIENGSSKTLCIPTVFVSYTGEALDHKAPLLKSLALIDKAATAVCEYFDKDVTHVYATLGVEQEYFLIDRALYFARPDLVMSGRTLFGHTPAKGQQLEDHYFGSIPSRVRAYMQDLEIEAYKLGIPLRTRHNEVAPSQFECAPTFEEINLANDHNQLLMDIMEKVAERHNFKVLLHEKPFAGINGSGKHNNWSLATNTGVNLLQPTSKAKENLQFLTFFVNIIKAVYENADLLRASIASAGNDFRLGANEAPPAIMSVFIGEQLTEVLDELEHNGNIKIDKGDNMYMKLGIDKIPPILLDNTDRNRTSPFAFTGNKFEFRAVGSSANCATALVVLNTIVADQLKKFKAEVDAQIEGGKKKEVAIVDVLREYIKQSKAIRFEGNGYSDEWVEEAAKRGLSNIKTTPHALEAYLSKKSRQVLVGNGIFSEVELEARVDVMLHNYALKVQIESRALGTFAMNQAIPSALEFQNKLIENARGLKELGLKEESEHLKDLIKDLSRHVNAIKTNVDAMIEARKAANELDTHHMAIAYCEKVKPFFDVIRYHVDKLELMVPDDMWPFPKYRELLFIK